jgi:hypothetical protein
VIPLTRYLAIEVDDALDISEHTEIQPPECWLRMDPESNSCGGFRA